MKDYIYKKLCDRINFWEHQIERSWNERELLGESEKEPEDFFEAEKRSFNCMTRTIRNERHPGFRKHNLMSLSKLLALTVLGINKEDFIESLIGALDYYFRLEDKTSIKTEEYTDAISELEKITGLKPHCKKSTTGLLGKLKINDNLGFLMSGEYLDAYSKFKMACIKDLVRLEKEHQKTFNNSRRSGDKESVLLLWNFFNKIFDDNPNIDFEKLKESFFLDKQSYRVASTKRDSKRREFIRNLIFHIMNTIGSDMAAKGVVDIIKDTSCQIPESISIEADNTIDEIYESLYPSWTVEDEIANDIFLKEGKIVDPETTKVVKAKKDDEE